MYVHRNTGGAPYEVPVMDFSVKGMLINDIRSLDIGTRRSLELYDVTVVFPKQVHQFQKVVFKGYNFNEAEMTGEAIYKAVDFDLYAARQDAHSLNASFSKQAITAGVTWDKNLVDASEKVVTEDAQLIITEKEKIELRMVIDGFNAGLFPVYMWPVGNALYIKLSSAADAQELVSRFFIYDMTIAEKRRSIAAEIEKATTAYDVAQAVVNIQDGYLTIPGRFVPPKLS